MRLLTQAARLHLQPSRFSRLTVCVPLGARLEGGSVDKKNSLALLPMVTRATFRHAHGKRYLYRNLTLVGVKGTPFSLDRVVYETLTALADAARRLAKRKLMLSSTVGVEMKIELTHPTSPPPSASPGTELTQLYHLTNSHARRTTCHTTHSAWCEPQVVRGVWPLLRLWPYPTTPSPPGPHNPGTPRWHAGARDGRAGEGGAV